MYGTDPTSEYFLYTHDDAIAITQPIPVLSVAGPIRASEPLDPVLEVYGTGQKDAEMSARELMWGLTIFALLSPLIGVFAGGFIGFVVGFVLGLILALCSGYVRHQRVVAIRNGRTDLEFTPAEAKVETVLGAITAAVLLLKVASWLEHRHARIVAQEINKLNH